MELIDPGRGLQLPSYVRAAGLCPLPTRQPLTTMRGSALRHESTATGDRHMSRHRPGSRASFPRQTWPWPLQAVAAPVSLIKQEHTQLWSLLERFKIGHSTELHQTQTQNFGLGDKVAGVDEYWFTLHELLRCSLGHPEAGTGSRIVRQELGRVIFCRSRSYTTLRSAYERQPRWGV